MIFKKHRCFLALAFAVTALAGCEAKLERKSIVFEKKNLFRESAEAELPGALWDLLEKVGYSDATNSQADEESAAPLAHGAKLEEAGKPVSSATGKTGRKRVTEFVPIKAFLYAKTEGALASRPVALEFPEGGGKIDFAEYLSAHGGAFYLFIELPEELKDAPFKAYFLSASRTVDIVGRRHGGGCAEFYDVTSYFKKSMEGPGILVSSAERRHALALGGTLFIAYAKGDHLKLAELTMRDSRFADAECRRRP